MLSRSSASLTPESKAMASSSIVRDAFPTIYPPGPSIASVNPRQPKRKRLDLRKVEKNEKDAKDCEEHEQFGQGRL